MRPKTNPDSDRFSLSHAQNRCIWSMVFRCFVVIIVVKEEIIHCSCNLPDLHRKKKWSKKSKNDSRSLACIVYLTISSFECLKCTKLWCRQILFTKPKIDWRVDTFELVYNCLGLQLDDMTFSTRSNKMPPHQSHQMFLEKRAIDVVNNNQINSSSFIRIKTVKIFVA